MSNYADEIRSLIDDALAYLDEEDWGEAARRLRDAAIMAAHPIGGIGIK